MDTTPFWESTARLKKRPRLSRNLSVDVVVIGGGITGLTAAYLLKKAGASVAVLERERFAAIDTGHTTAHLTYVTDLRISELEKSFGRDHARAVWDSGQAALQQIEKIIADEEIDCEHTHVPGFLHAPISEIRRDEIARVKKDAQLAAELGFDAQFVDEAPLVKRPAVRFANQAKFHPRKYIRGLLGAMEGKGMHLFEETGADEVQPDPLAVKANGHTIRCTHLFIATHVPLQGIAGTVGAALFQSKLSPYTSYVVGARIPRGIIPEASFWDTGTPYDYLRVDRRRRHDYAIFGGADHKTGQKRAPEKNFRELEMRLQKLIPRAVVDHRWSGQVIETNDGLPFIGETAPKQFVATGFSGNGMTFGTLGAMMVSEAINGHTSPWAALYDPKRKMIHGAWDYVKENMDYPYYILKDFFSKPPERSLRSIKRGDGKIVLSDGKKVAAFRDSQGKLSLCSAVCTHLGCTVRWNSAEKTWDCPCHGSRFKLTGEVIAGPAEAALGKL